MKIAGAHTVPLPRQETYRRMQDPEVLARSMPGCESLEPAGEGQYHMKMKMALASMSGAFNGKVTIADSAPPDSFRLIVEGAGKLGFMKGEGLLKFTPLEQATEVSYEGDIQVGGTLAAVGQRLIDATARMMIKRFFETLAA